MTFAYFWTKAARSLNRAQFALAARAVRRTPAVRFGSIPYSLLSMVQHRDVLSYLLAVKSFCRFVPPSRVVLVADPTLTADDRAIIAKHIPGVVIREAEQFHDPSLPRGGTWERLVAISEEVAHGYVVQLDSDTVALRSLDEVKSAILNGRAFVLGTEDNQSVEAGIRIAELARRRGAKSAHVQDLAESQLDKLGPEFGRYVRGCSGFTGFPRGSFNRETLKAVSAAMAPHLGDQWSAWGTEQFSSNLIVANIPGSTVLPHPIYCNPLYEKPETVFMHFIGYARFVTDRYARVARDVCGALRDGQPRQEADGG